MKGVLFFMPGWNSIPVFLTEMSSSRDEISCRQERVNNKRHSTIDRDDFAARRVSSRVSSRNEISRVSTLLNVLVPLSNMYRTPYFLVCAHLELLLTLPFFQTTTCLLIKNRSSERSFTVIKNCLTNFHFGKHQPGKFMLWQKKTSIHPW